MKSTTALPSSNDYNVAYSPVDVSNTNVLDIADHLAVNVSTLVWSTVNNSSEPSIYMGSAEAAIASLLWTIMLLTAIVGNLMVIAAIFTSPALYIVQNFLLVSLAVADILVSL